MDASNVALQCQLGDGDEEILVVYKPVRGERELWDFPDGTLAGRETAAFLLSEAGGWGLVPPTVLRDGPLGEGTVQEWVLEAPGSTETLIGVLPRRALSAGWLPVFDAETYEGTRVVVAHADRPDLAAAAVFDAVANNADRKGSHLVLDTAGRLRGFDHGLTFHEQTKLRTVLWGWAGDPLPSGEVDRLCGLGEQLGDLHSPLRKALDVLLTGGEVVALLRRVDRLVSTGVFPEPTGRRPAIPWPPL